MRVEGGREKPVRIELGRGERAHHKKIVVSRLDSWIIIILSTDVYGMLSCRAGHGPCVRNLSWSIRRWNPPRNTEDNLRAGLIVIEAWFRGYRRRPGLGRVRTARLCTLAGLLDREDTRLKTSSRVQMGLSLAWKEILAIRM